MVKKQLVFYFHVPDDYETNVAIRMHYACLYRYRDIFDAAEFFISYTEESKKYEMAVKYSLLNIFHDKDVRFKDVENGDFREATTFKENIVDKLDKFDNTIVFFGHTKGTTNVVTFSESSERFLKWIYALYFYSLEFMYEVEKKLIAAYHGRMRSLFGSLMTRLPGGRVMYAGTFYWINPMAVANDLKFDSVTPVKFADRLYAEMFPTMYGDGVINDTYISKVDGHSCIESNLGDFDPYHDDFDEIIKYYGDYDLFMKNYNELIKEIQ